MACLVPSNHQPRLGMLRQFDRLDRLKPMVLCTFRSWNVSTKIGMAELGQQLSKSLCLVACSYWISPNSTIYRDPVQPSTNLNQNSKISIMFQISKTSSSSSSSSAAAASSSSSSSPLAPPVYRHVHDDRHPWQVGWVPFVRIRNPHGHASHWPPALLLPIFSPVGVENILPKQGVKFMGI